MIYSFPTNTCFLAKLIILCKWRIIKSNFKLGSKLQKLHLYFCILYCICFISVPTTNLHPLLLLNSFIDFWGGLGPSHKLSLFVYCSPPILGAHIPNNSSLLHVLSGKQQTESKTWPAECLTCVGHCKLPNLCYPDRVFVISIVLIKNTPLCLVKTKLFQYFTWENIFRFAHSPSCLLQLPPQSLTLPALEGNNWVCIGWTGKEKDVS